MIFQGPKAGPGSWQIRAHFIYMTPLHGVGKKVQNFLFGPPFRKAGYGPVSLRGLLFLFADLILMNMTMKVFINWIV